MQPKRVDVAVGVLIEVREGRRCVLVARRHDDAVLGGYWELPGGKVEAGEALAHCVQREFAEELGLTVQAGAAMPIIEHQYDHAHVHLHPYLCTRIAGEPRSLQVAEHRWVAIDNLSTICFPPANAPLMEQIRRLLATDMPRQGGNRDEHGPETRREQ
ncbi:MAG: (deoxy)nucleoside triphosphate pyrophosphohydrolase [Phycisphaeraceae bacterium]